MIVLLNNSRNDRLWRSRMVSSRSVFYNYYSQRSQNWCGASMTSCAWQSGACSPSLPGACSPSLSFSNLGTKFYLFLFLFYLIFILFLFPLLILILFISLFLSVVFYFYHHHYFSFLKYNVAFRSILLRLWGPGAGPQINKNQWKIDWKQNKKT